MTTVSDHIATLDLALEVFNRHDVRAFTGLYAPDAVVSDPQYPQPLRGAEAIEQDFIDLLRAFPDARGAHHRAIRNGDLVALESTIWGWHTGPLALPDGEVAPTGRPMSFDLAHLFRFDGEGRIVENYRYYDIAGWLRQLGLA